MERTDERCGTCRFGRLAARLTDNGRLLGTALACKRFPPQVNYVLMIDTNTPISCFPEISETEWCGEYQPKETSDA